MAVRSTSSPISDTPMMQQYLSIKSQYPDAILFFRMGDFYEMFNEDAIEASKILEITLTSRNKNKENAIPMCGIPHHSSHLYIAKLIKNSKNVAICEQTEDPRFAKGLVKRDVVRIVTPGTVLDETLLDPKSNHFLASLSIGKNSFGLANLDLSTGLFRTTEITLDKVSIVEDEIMKISPKELIVSESYLKDKNSKNKPQLGQISCHALEDFFFSQPSARETLLKHFRTNSLEGFGCETLPQATVAAGIILHYLQETQKTQLKHILTLRTTHIENHMALDQPTIKSLELVQASDGSRKNSLLNLLDCSETPMGARQIHGWILKPLTNIESVQKRLDIVSVLTSNPLLRNSIRDALKNIFDMERLLGRIALGSANPKDLISLKSSLAGLPRLEKIIQEKGGHPLKGFLSEWDNIDCVFNEINTTLMDDPPFQIKDGDVIKPGFDKELDHLRTIAKNGNQAIADLEKKEREFTGIPTLKVGYNKIYGYYLEITKKHIDRIPDNFIRKQSLVNAERYISPELKDLETEISGSQEQSLEKEQFLFKELLDSITKEGLRVQHMAVLIGKLDALLSFADVAHNNDYCLPKINDDDSLQIKDGRHPLIEKISSNGSFIANDTHLNCHDQQVIILTGPNMAGKSTYLRQVALITLMAQIGSFVPARDVEIGLVDRIFSRVGAQDHLLKGQSTFMVEMNETAQILNHATNKSLIIFDEVGRGTSTFDGLSLAWSIVEHLHGPDRIGAKTLFASHYHELTELSQTHSGVKNFCVQVKEWNDEIIFLRKIIPGGADKSYGIQVARLAGLPTTVLNRAKEVLHNLENQELDDLGAPKFAQHSPPCPLILLNNYTCLASRILQ